MRVLVRKMSSLGLMKLELIVGTVVMAAAMLALPIGLLCTDASLLANPYVLGVVVIGMLFFAGAGYFGYIRRYRKFCEFPEVQAETDGEFLYIHTKKEAKIPLADLTEATVYGHLPYLLQKEFVREIIVHIFSEEYGYVVLEIPGYGTYKMWFVAYAKDTADELLRFLNETMNRT